MFGMCTLFLIICLACQRHFASILHWEQVGWWSWGGQRADSRAEVAADSPCAWGSGCLHGPPRLQVPAPYCCCCAFCSFAARPECPRGPCNLGPSAHGHVHGPTRPRYPPHGLAPLRRRARTSTRTSTWRRAARAWSLQSWRAAKRRRRGLSRRRPPAQRRERGTSQSHISSASFPVNFSRCTVCIPAGQEPLLLMCMPGL